MAGKKTLSKNRCTSHNVTICPRNKYVVSVAKAEIELKHDSSIAAAINKIISEWATYRGIEIPI